MKIMGQLELKRKYMNGITLMNRKKGKQK